MEKRNFTIYELVHNPSFRRMIQGKASSGDISYWSQWMEANDENREKAKKAASQITGFELADPFRASDYDFEKEWSRLYQATKAKSKRKYQPFLQEGVGFRWIYRLAAILMLGSMVGLGALLYSQSNRTQSQSEQIASLKTVVTLSNQLKTLTFSNGAKIVLNSNTKLIYSVGSNKNHTIHVSLAKGGAFFSDKNVAAEKGGQKHTFLVTTPDGRVNDIGTEFVVTVDKSGSSVILQNGHIRIETAKEGNTSGGYNMKRGEMVTLKKLHILKKENVNPTFYTAWATGFIQFNRTPVKMFARYVEKRFNIKVVIVDPGLTGVTLGGAVYFKSLEGLVRSVSAATKVPVYLSGDQDTVYIGNPNNSKKRN